MRHSVKRFSMIGVAAALCGLLPTPADAKTLYQVLDLGDLGGPFAAAAAINKTGVMTGTSWNPAADDRAFRTGKYLAINPATDDLGHLGGSESQGFAINDGSVVVGSSSIQAGNWRAFRRTSVMVSLGTLGGNNSWAYGINTNSQIVGAAQNAAGNLRAFLFNGGAMASLGTLGGAESSAQGINNAGRIVGWAEIAGGFRHAFRTAPLAAINPATDDLGTLGGNNSEAYAINGAGTIVGHAQDAAGDWLAFRYSGGTMTSLGTLGGVNSKALAVNSSGVIVGWSQIPGGAMRAFVYEDGAMTNLNDLLGPSNWTLIEATGVNENGDIVGYGTVGGGAATHAFLLRPVKVKALTLSPSSVVGSGKATAKVTLTQPAPAELQVAISVLNPAAHVTTSAGVVPAGSNFATFVVSTDPVATGTTGNIVASYGGASKAALLTVLPISVKSVTSAPKLIVGSKTAAGKVYLEFPAAPGDITVNLSSSNPAVASVPASVNVLAGASTASFPITTSAVTTDTVVEIKAEANGRSKVVNVTVRPIAPKTVTFTPNTVSGGTSSIGKVTLEAPAAPGDIVVTLTSVDPTIVSVPVTVTVPAGSTSITFTADTFSPLAVTKVGVHATAAGFQKTGYLTVNP